MLGVTVLDPNLVDVIHVMLFDKLLYRFNALCVISIETKELRGSQIQID